MPDLVKTKKLLREIHRLSNSFPSAGCETRLQNIGDLIAGKIVPLDLRKKMNPDIHARIVAGQASRSPRTAADKRPKARVEEDASGLNRMESGGNKRKNKAVSDPVPAA